ncbi:MAG: hypothetical protein WDW38_004332 [Sanguina aurantia]
MENISVSVRLRPLNRQEAQEGFAWRVDGKTVYQIDPNTREADKTRDTRYTLDHVFMPEWTTRQIYDAAAQGLIQKVINGINTTVFAYGQTSSGKTFTMRGTPNDPGLISLAVTEAFQLLHACQDREFLIRVSYMELYNEEVNDLLAPENVKLPVHESKENGVYICGLREDIVTTPEQVLSLLDEGESHRHIGSTKMNETSSRSHTVFRMVVESRQRNTEGDEAGAILVSTLTLVDLAGSERVAKTGAEGLRMKEGTAINKSLLTLGTVINKLAEGTQAAGGHIPYRDSKLTRILQPSLGGNAKTAIIAAMTPAACHVEESHSTLRFASRAKRVVNNAVVNEVLSDAAVLHRQAKEIEELKKRLAGSGLGADVRVQEQIGALRGQLLLGEQEKELMRTKLEEEKMEREKAQKQAEVAKKMMLDQQRGSGDDALAKRSNRRETWCPGAKGGWAAPPGALSDSEEASASDLAQGGDSLRKKRPLLGKNLVPVTAAGPADVPGTTAAAAAASLGTLEEEGDEGSYESEEEERGLGAEGEEAQGGPTPQRQRREGRRFGVTLNVTLEEEEEDARQQQQRQTPTQAQQLTRLANSLPEQGKLLIQSVARQLEEGTAKVEHLESQLMQACQVSEEQEQANSVLATELAEREGLIPQLEQLKWQARQLERKLEDSKGAGQTVSQERDALTASLTKLELTSEADHASLGARNLLLSEENTAVAAQLKALHAEMHNAKGQLELQVYEMGLLQARERSHAAEVAKLELRLSEKDNELSALRRAVKESEESLKEVEGRTRELKECNQRLAAHVQDLESRKRAPLYQKKQEEELRAVTEKAAEAETRAADAELRAKEACSELETAQQCPG